MIGVAFGLGFILGPGIGGPLADISPRLPFWVAAGFSLANWLYGYIFVPESLRQEHRKFSRCAAPIQSGRCPASLPSRAMEARQPPISRLRVARSFRHLGALRDLSLRLEPDYNRHFTCAGRRVHGRDFRRTHRTNRRVVGGTAYTLYRTFFGAVGWSLLVWPEAAGLYGFNPGDFDVEHFLPGSAGNDDTSGGREGTGRIAGSNPKPALDRIRHWAVLIFGNICLVHQSETFALSARRAVLSGSRVTVHSDAVGDAG